MEKRYNMIDDEEFNFHAVIYFFRKNYIKIFLLTLISLLIGTFLVLFVLPTYSSNAQILIEKKEENSFELGSLQGFSDKSTIEDKIQILESRTIAEKTINNLLSSKNPEDQKLFLFNTKKYEPKGFRKKFESILTFGGLINNYPDLVEDVFDEFRIKQLTKKLQESLSVNHVQGTNILSITIESIDPYESKKLVDFFIGAYIAKEKEWANKVTGSKINFLEQQITKKINELNLIEDTIQNFQEKQNIYNEDGDAALLLTNLIELENEINKEKILFEDLKNRKKLFEEESKKNDIPKSYDLAVKDSIRNLKILIELSETRIENINTQLIDYQKILEELPKKTKNFIRLKRGALILNNTLMLLEENLQSTKVVYESESGPAQIIVLPQVNLKKVSPKVMNNLSLSLLLGFTISCFFFYIKEKLNTSIVSVEDVENYGLNVLSIIPSIGSEKKRKKNKIVQNKDIYRRLILTEDPKSPISEAYRTLRTSIMYSDSNNKNNRVIMVSSPGPGEGKTTTVCNLAITYANLGKKTLLIDGDLRKPVIKKIFKLKNSGITDAIFGSKSEDEVIQKTEIENFDVIASGVIPPNPSEILNSDKMKNLIDDLKVKYDIILIDSPPMIAVTDSLVLSRLVDNFILVCRSNVSQKGALDRSCKSLSQIGGKFSGAVLNAVDKNESYGSGYYYNYYQYYYGEK